MYCHADAPPALALEQLLAALQTVQAGDFSVRLPGHQTGIAGKIADTFNDIVSTNQRLARQLERVGDVVGKQGNTGQRVTIGSGKGAWGEMETSVNTMVDQLRSFASEVTRVAREVDHRANNTLAVVQAIIRMAKRDNVEDYVKALEGRIGALAQSHELLSQSRWEGADILHLILDELAPYHGEGQQRVTAMGPSLMLVPEQAQLLAMAIHELATNAAKYGSLSVSAGRVDVSWSTFEGVLSLIWRESNGPKAQRPNKFGFGTRVISSLGAGRSGRTEFDWRPSGLSFALEMQLRDHTGDGNSVKEAENKVGPRLLLVEDELVVGMFMQEALELIGYRPTNPIGHLAEAVAAAKSERFLGAVLDMNLHGEIVYPLAELLTAQSVPFLFVTGYAPHTIDPRFASIPILQKPVLEEQLSTALQRVLGRQEAMSQQRMVLG
jgi:two-component sensor histidine kinase/CheY-like chemotaxis protein